MKKIFTPIAIISFVFLGTSSFSQGCIAIRNITPFGSQFDNSAKTWQFSANYRYFRSFRHFVGTEEQTQRVENHTEVINNDNSLIFGANFTLNSRWNFSAAIPFLYIDRSSLYEHLGNSTITNPDQLRFHTHSQGIGDMRLMAYYSLIPNSAKWRLQVGLGTKLPTGNYNYKDYFHKSTGLQLQPVDQSVQPGDGGVGAIVEYNATRALTNRMLLYSNGLYMVNPRNTNGTIKGSNELSVADQFFFRLGGQYAFGNLQVGLGGRIEGIPARDVIGKSDGFRRPGYIISVEPSVMYMHGNHIFGLNVPIALVRNRTQSVLDLRRQQETGIPTHGDAAFADYLISVSYAYRLMKKVF
jgi:hypothetical protein